MRISLGDKKRSWLAAAICILLAFALGALWQRGLSADWAVEKVLAEAPHAIYSETKDITKRVVVFVDDLVREASDLDSEVTGSEKIARQQKDLWTLTTILNCIQIIGVPLAVVLFLSRIVQEYNKKRLALEGFEIERYEKLQQHYIDFLKLNMDNPRLDFGPWPYAVDVPLTPEEGYKRAQLGWILITIFEKAYLVRKTMGKKRWRHWQDFMTDYCRSDVFRHIWTWNDAYSVSVDNQIDAEFEKFFKKLLQSAQVSKPSAYRYLLDREQQGDATQVAEPQI